MKMCRGHQEDIVPRRMRREDQGQHDGLTVYVGKAFLMNEAVSRALNEASWRESASQVTWGPNSEGDMAVLW